jgi:hypothetical protein
VDLEHPLEIGPGGGGKRRVGNQASVALTDMAGGDDELGVGGGGGGEFRWFTPARRKNSGKSGLGMKQCMQNSRNRLGPMSQQPEAF